MTAMTAMTEDVTIIGAGIVGLASALALKEAHPRLKVTVLEKEPGVAHHQTGHNSGVIHSGVYYRPGSLKARLCVEGVRLMTGFCEAHGVPYERCGKVIVATREAELARLEALYARGLENGVPGLELVDARRLKEIEPHARGLGAVHVPGAAIVDYRQVAEAMAAALREAGVRVERSAKVTGIEPEGSGLAVHTSRMTVRSRSLINCAGLYSDSVARLAGASPGVSIVPFRGEYYLLKPKKRHLVKGMIYPVADPELPFLGVHFTRRIHGEVEAGPNAVLALGREGYRHRDIHVRELLKTMRFEGFWPLARRYWRTGMGEYYRSFSKAAFVRELKRLLPELEADDLVRAGAGVRAQAVDTRGRLIDDFVFTTTENALHVLNAPSPAATASLAIGRYIARAWTEAFAVW
jgi:(S)-2-hydroxyglutarate dehydrogenase